MLVQSSNNKSQLKMAKFNFLNQSEPFVTKLHFSTPW